MSKVGESPTAARRRRPDPPRPLRPRRSTRRRARARARDGYLIREAALGARVPCITTLSGAAAVVHAIASARTEIALSLQERIDAETRTRVASSRASRSGPTRSSGSTAAAIEPGAPGQFFMLEAPGRLLPRPMSLCLAPPGELAFLIDPIGPGTRALCALEPGERIHVFGPLGNGFRLDVERPLLVGGGIGVAPFPYLSRGARRTARPCSASAPRTTPRRRRSSRTPRSSIEPDVRHRARRPDVRRARLRARADARSGAGARPARAARVGGADGLRARRLLRLRGGDRRRSYSASASQVRY